MNEKIKFGKNSGIDLNILKGGLRKEKLKSDSHKLLFDSIDTDKNGILDDNEISYFRDSVDIENKDKSKNDGFISKKEAKEFIKNNKLEIKEEELITFLQMIFSEGANIKSTKTEEKDGIKYFTAESEGETLMLNLADMSYTRSTEDTEGCKSVKYFNSQDVLLKEVITNKNGKTEIITYDDSGKPLQKEVKHGSTLNISVYDDAGEEQLVKTIENQGIDGIERSTDYQRMAGGVVNKIITQSGNKTVQVFVDDVLLEEEITTPESKVKTKYSKEGNVVIETKDNKETVTQFNSEGNKLSQTVTTKDGQTYEVKYDGKGNTYIIVQINELPSVIAKKFGVSEAVLLRNNKYTVDGLGNKDFGGGSEIKIPGELDADDERLFGRKDHEGVNNDYVVFGGAAREAAINAEVASRKNITWVEKKNNTFEAVARYLFSRENVENPSTLQLSARIKDLKKDNPTLKDGQIIGKKITAGVSQQRYNTVLSAEQQRQTNKLLAEENKRRLENFDLCKDLYHYCSSNTYACNDKAFKDLLHKINPQNVVDVLNQYKSYMKKTKASDTSLIDTIRSEFGEDSNKEALNYIMNQLEQAAVNAGVRKYDINSSVLAFRLSVNSYHSGPTTTHCMEQYVDDVVNQITSTQNRGGNISTTDAVKGFKAQAEDLNKTTQNEYSEARKNDNWAGKTGDVVCGWFGCKTVNEMNKKLATYDKDMQDLIKTAQSGDIKAFKDKYFEMFKVEFDSAKVQARENAINKYVTAQMYESTKKFFNELADELNSVQSKYNNKKNKTSWDETCLRLALFYQNKGVTGSSFEKMLKNYADTNNLSFESYKDKFTVLKNYIKTSYNTAESNRINSMGGKSYNELEQDINNCNNALFKVNGNLLPEVREFNQNMHKTQAYTEMIAEVGITVATMAVPGAGSAAAAKLATVASRCGTVGARVAKTLNFVSKGFNTASKALSSDSLAVQMAANGIATGVGSTTAELITKGEVDFQQILKNSLYGSLGAFSSKLSEQFVEKLSKKLTSGLGQKIVQESSEDIIDAVLSFVVESGNYDSVDAYTDAAMNFVMSRIGGSKGSVKSKDTETSKVIDVKDLEMSEQVFDFDKSRKIPNNNYMPSIAGESASIPRAVEPVEMTLKDRVKSSMSDVLKDNPELLDVATHILQNYEWSENILTSLNRKILECKHKNDGNLQPIKSILYRMDQACNSNEFLGKTFGEVYTYFADLLKDDKETLDNLHKTLNEGFIDKQLLYLGYELSKKLTISGDVITEDKRKDIIKNYIKLSEAAETITNKKFANYYHSIRLPLPVQQKESLLEVISHMESSLTDIKDPDVKTYIESIMSKDVLDDRAMNEIYDLINVENTINGKYSMLKSNRYTSLNEALVNDSYRTEMLKWLKANSPDIYQNLDNSKTSAKVESDYVSSIAKSLSDDHKLMEKYQETINYIKKYPDSSMNEHLYDRYLKDLETQGIPAPIIEECRKFNEKYGTKIFVSKDTAEALKVCKYLNEEFTKWVQASNGQSKFPPVIDFNKFRTLWHDEKAAYGQGCASGLSDSVGGSLSFPGFSESNMKSSLRHELTHSNDRTMHTKYTLPEKYGVLDTRERMEQMLCEYKNEFKKAGISDEVMLSYAYNNHEEFIAVASQGDMSKYSPEFKQVLIELGMPEWVFNLDS